MGGLVPRSGNHADDFLSEVDVGPPKAAFLPHDRAYSLESVAAPGHFVRHRNSELWADARGPELSELYAYDASFVLVNGLLGHSCSLRSANFPLEFVRHRDSKMYIGAYDGSRGMRADATFEFRMAEMEEPRTTDVCVMLAECPGKYLAVDKDNRLVVESYDHVRRRAFTFRAVPGLALEWSQDIDEPVLFEDDRGEGAHDGLLSQQGWDAACVAAKSLLARSLAATPKEPTAGGAPAIRPAEPEEVDALAPGPASRPAVAEHAATQASVAEHAAVRAAGLVEVESEASARAPALQPAVAGQSATQAAPQAWERPQAALSPQPSSPAAPVEPLGSLHEELRETEVQAPKPPALVAGPSPSPPVVAERAANPRAAEARSEAPSPAPSVAVAAAVAPALVEAARQSEFEVVD